MARLYESLSWQNVNVEDAIPAVSMPITITRLVIAAGGERDFNRLHHDIEYTKTTGNRTAFANTFFQQGFLNRVVNEWMGPGGDLKKLRIAMRSPIYIGTTMTGSGTVVGKRQEDGLNLVDLSLTLSTEDGLCTEATVTVSLP